MSMHTARIRRTVQRQAPPDRRCDDLANTPIHYVDPLHTRMVLDLIKKRIKSAIRSEFALDTPAYQWMRHNARKYTAGLRRLPPLRYDVALLSEAFTDLFSLHSTRMVLATCALRKKRPAICAQRIREIESIARRMDTATCAQPVFSDFISGTSGTRVTHAYGLADYSRQMAVADFISYVGPSPYNDFGAAGGGGVGAHIRHIRQLVADGYIHFFAADVRRAFSSLRPHDVTNLLSIPEWALENLLFSEDVPGALTTPSTGPTRPDASCGLPQGSVCSGSAWSMVAGNILRPLGGDRRDISQHVDDVLACARSRPELEHLLLRIEEEFSRASGGRLRLGKIRIISLRTQPLDFLGYRISLTPDGLLSVRPSPAAWQKAESRCYEKLEAVCEDSFVPDARELLGEAEEYFRGWIASHSEWRPAEVGIKERLMCQRVSEVWHRFCWENDVALPDIV